MADKKHNRIRKDSVMIAFDVIKYILLTITSLLCVLPFVLIVSGSITSNETILREGYSILPRDISCDTVSGGVTLTLPENGGFSATLDSVSGDLTVDGFAGSLHRDEFVYGQGGPAYEFDSVSGDVHIRCA